MYFQVDSPGVGVELHFALLDVEKQFLLDILFVDHLRFVDLVDSFFYEHSPYHDDVAVALEIFAEFPTGKLLLLALEKLDWGECLLAQGPFGERVYVVEAGDCLCLLELGG